MEELADKIVKLTANTMDDIKLIESLLAGSDKCGSVEAKFVTDFYKNLVKINTLTEYYLENCPDSRSIRKLDDDIGQYITRMDSIIEKNLVSN